MEGSVSIETHSVDGLDERAPFRDWAPELQAQWRDNSAATVNRELRFLHTIGLATCLVCLLLDAQAGVLELGLWLRLGLVVPAYLVALALLRRGDGLTRTLATVVPVALYVGVASYLGLAAQGVYTDRYVMASAVLIAFCLVLLPLRIGAALCLAAAGFGAIATPVLALSANGGDNTDLLVFTLLCCSVPIALKLRSDRVRDSNFLLTLKSRRAQEELLAINRQLERLSSIDGLTAVLNRRGFDERFAAAFAAARKADETLAVLLLDIDHFKRFNDTHGHQAGDRCLIAVGGLLNAAFEERDGFAGRYGGEEFIAALVGETSREAEAVANRIRMQIGALDILDHKGQADSITVSIGVRIGSPASTSRDRFVSEADRALYAAKDAGRNRVVVLEDGAAAATVHQLSRPKPRAN